MHQQSQNVSRFQKHTTKPIRLLRYSKPRSILGMLLVLMFLALPKLALAEDTLDSGDTAWLLTSTALVLFMTIPGLALFYGGLVRTKNVLSVLMQCFALTGLITIIWIVIGYSLAFDTTGMAGKTTNAHSFIGGLGKIFLSGVTADSLSGTIPETVFICFQLTFAIITPALIAGAFAERMKFSAMLWFMGALVYNCVCANLPHGVEWRRFILRRYFGRTRFCGWDRGARQRRYCGTYCRTNDWQTPRLS